MFEVVHDQIRKGTDSQISEGSLWTSNPTKPDPTWPGEKEQCTVANNYDKIVLIFLLLVHVLTKHRDSPVHR